MIRRLAIGALALAGACQTRTELMIGVATDLRAPDALDHVELTVTRVDNGEPEPSQSWKITGHAGQDFNLPGSYGMQSDGTEFDLDLVLDGVKDGSNVVERHAILSLVSGQTLFYRMTIVAGCIGRDDCAQGQTCVEGACQPIAIDAHQLPAFDPALVTELSCNSGTAFIDTGTDMAMPVSGAGSACPADLCSEGTCLLPPPPADPSQTRTVTGTDAAVTINTRGTTVAPVDLSAATITLVPAGATTPLTGVGSSNGTFSIAGVPQGEYTLQVGTDFYVASGDSLDISADVDGDVDCVAPTAGAPVDFQLSNLDPWIVGDQLEAYTGVTSMFWFQLDQTGSAGEPGSGVTSVDELNTAANGTAQQCLLEANQGDTLVVEQLAQRVSPEGTPYLTADKAATTSVTQTDGQTSTVALALQPVTPTGAIDIRLDEPAFEAAVGWDGTHANLLGPAINDPAFFTAAGNVIDVMGEEDTANFGFAGATADWLLLFANAGPQPATQPVVATGMQFAPVEAPGDAWGVVVLERWTAVAEFNLPGTTVPAFFGVALENDVPLGAQPATWEPVLGPVRSPTIDGADLFASQVNVSVTPTIAWQVPSIGAPKQYVVQISQLTLVKVPSANNKTVSTQVATFHTPDPSVAVPAGLLQPNAFYVVRITATDDPSLDAPNRNRTPVADSTVASQLI